VGINNSIDNPIAGTACLAFASLRVGPAVRDLQREFGFRRLFLVKTGSADERRVLHVQKLIFGFFGAWLALYLFLDWLF
jgi:hypothetical protein